MRLESQRHKNNKRKEKNNAKLQDDITTYNSSLSMGLHPSQSV